MKLRLRSVWKTGRRDSSENSNKKASQLSQSDRYFVERIQFGQTMVSWLARLLRLTALLQESS